MGKHKWGTFNKRVRLLAFSFDVHASIVIGFALHWTWVWVTFWSSAFYSVSPGVGQTTSGIMTLEPLWLLSLLTNVFGYGALFVLSKKQRVFGCSMFAPLCAGAVTLVGAILVSYPSATTFGDASSFVYVFGALLTGVGSALEVVLWGELLSILGARQTIVYSVLATIVGSALYLLITFLPDQVARFLTALLPAAEMWLFVRRQSIVRNARMSSLADVSTPGDDDRVPGCETARNALLEIAGISLFFGLSYGVMKGFFVFGSETLITVRDYLNIAALILGAAAILITTSVFRMDFRHMTYQVALPLMAVGFIFFSLDYPVNLIGFAAHQMGYQYFYIIIWALWALLTRKLNMPAGRFVCISMAALMAGQLAGSIAGAQLVAFATDRYTMAIIAACSVFIILLVALFAFESPFPGSGWGVFRPLVRDETAPKFKRSLMKLAEMRGLSPRETQVLELLAKGRNCSFISAQLIISEETAKTHIKKIYRKFGVHSQQALLDMIELDGKCD